MAEFVTSKGVHIYYEVHGTDGPPLVLLHGLSSATPIWEPQIPAFEKHYRVYSFDYPGHGQSQHTRGYSIQLLVDVLREFMDYHQLERAHLMGLSLGCAVALTFAVQCPNRVSSLILEGPVGGANPPWYPSGWFKMLVLTTYLSLLFVLWVLFGMERTVYLVNRYGYQTYGAYPLLQDLEKRVDPWALGILTLALAYPPYIGHLEAVIAPTLIIQGDSDITPKSHWMYIMNHVKAPCQRIIIDNARHVVAIEKPQAFNETVLSFLGTLSLSSES